MLCFHKLLLFKSFIEFKINSKLFSKTFVEFPKSKVASYFLATGTLLKSLI